MSEIINQAIRKSPLFEHLDARWKNRLIQASVVRNFDAGETVIEEGKGVDALFIVLSGKIRVWSRVGERVVELQTLESGAYFGEVSLLSGKPATASVEAGDEKVGLLALGRDILVELVADNTDIRRMLEDSTLARAKDTIGKVLE